MSWKAATTALVAGVIVIGALTLPSYGITVDEESSLMQGDLVLQWYASGFTDRRAIEAGNFRLYGGFANGTAALLHRLLGTGLYETGHAVSAVFGLIGLLLAGWVGRRLGGPRAGFLSVLFLALTPVYYGHSFVNIKDIPFAVMSLASFAAIVWAWPAMPRLERRHLIVLGVTIGLTMAVRVAGVVWFAYLGAAGVASLGVRRVADVRERGAELRRLLIDGVRIAAVAWLVMLPLWPYAQVNPVEHPLRALVRLLRFRDWIGPMLFNGRDVLSTELPRTYVPVWFGIVLPETYFAAALLTLSAIALRRAQPATPDRRGARILTALLAFIATLPLLTAIAGRPILYDGMRHFLFVVPPLAILAGLGASWFFDVVTDRRGRFLGALALAATAALTFTDMVRLHPYQSVYFNRLTIGGLPGAHGRFETDYWGESFKAGAEWLIANASEVAPGPVRIAVCAGYPIQVAYYLEGSDLARRVTMVKDTEPHDLLVGTTRWGCGKRAGRDLHVVRRFGVPLLFIKDQRER